MNPFHFRIFNEGVNETLSYRELVLRQDIIEKLDSRDYVKHMDGRAFVMGRDIFLFRPAYLAANPDKRKIIEALRVTENTIPISHFAPSSQSALDFLNDEENDVLGMIGPNRVGKAQPVDTIIPTPSGPTRLGDLAVGDEVFDKNGNVCRVTEVFDRGLLPIYRVSLDKGEVETLACGEHLWWYLRHNRAHEKDSSTHNEWEVLSTEEIISIQGLESAPQTRGYIPICGAAQYPEAALPIDPYALGCLIGDGGLTGPKSVKFSSADQFILDELQRRLSPLMIIHDNKYGYRIQPSLPLRHKLIELGLYFKGSHEKFIPDPYKISSANQRLDLLRGLMDTDGYVDSRGVISEFCSTSQRLAEDVSELVRSLGGKARISSKRPTYSYKGEKLNGRTAYVVRIRMRSNPFLLPRKKDKFRASTHNPNRLVYDITPCGEAECRCISVDSADQSYLTNDYIVTHNTATAFIRIILDSIPNDPNWPIFKQYGVRVRPFDGPKKIGIATYKWQLQKNKIWPDLRRWIPDNELGAYSRNFRGGKRKDVQWDRNPRIELACGTVIQFFVYEQDQDLFESDAMHHFLWDEQGKEVLFDGIDERLRTLRGTHIFALTPHRVEGRPDTGAGGWIHKLFAGTQTKGHDVGSYTCSIEDVPHWIYPEDQKAKAFEKHILEPQRTGNIKALREGRSRYFGEWHESSGLIYDEWDRNVHLIAPEDFNKKIRISDCTLYRGLDHGTVNPTTCLWFAVHPSGFIFLFRCFYSRGKTIYQNVRDIVALSGNELRESLSYKDPHSGQFFPRFEEVEKAMHIRKSVLDGRSFKQTEASSGRDIGWLYRSAGIHVHPASGKHAHEAIPFVKQLLLVDDDRTNPFTGKKGAPKLFVVNTQDMAPFIREIEGYIPDPNASRWDTANPKETPRKKDDHTMSALLYASQIPLRFYDSFRPLHSTQGTPHVKRNSYTGY